MFVPHDYSCATVSPMPQVGQKRIYTNLAVGVSAPKGVNVHLCFQSKEVNSVVFHFCLWHRRKCDAICTNIQEVWMLHILYYTIYMHIT